MQAATPDLTCREIDEATMKGWITLLFISI